MYTLKFAQKTRETSRNICIILIKQISHNVLYLFTRLKADSKAVIIKQQTSETTRIISFTYIGFITLPKMADASKHNVYKNYI